MSKEIYISSTPHETRLAIVESDELTEIYYERENEYTLAGSIYNGKVTRVLPGMQSSFVDVGLERDAFLYITDFMEEAGDSAEFDHGSDSERAPRQSSRQPRPEADRAEPSRSSEQRDEPRRDRAENGRRDSSRGRNGEGRAGFNSEPASTYVSERTQEQARATPAADLERASEGRGDEFGGRGERNDRGGRNRGRGRRDRGGNQDQTQVRPSASSLPTQTTSLPAEDDHQTSTVSFEEADSPSWETPLVAATGAHPASGDAANGDVGEGAPGADGSRRWRGRRGRRRGRGAAQIQAAPGQSGSEQTPEVTQTADQSDSSDFDEVQSFDIDGAGTDTPEQAPSMLLQAPASKPDGSQLGGRDRSSDAGNPRGTGRREEAPRDDRSGGGRGRNDREAKGDRGGRNQSNLRAPRGFAPTRSLYGVDAAGEPEYPASNAESLAESQPEPLILPGESLSKYRRPEAAAASSGSRPEASSTPILPPPSAFIVDPSWDGGSILPGETISRHRGAPGSSASAPRRGDRAEFTRSGGGRDRDRSSGHGDRHNARPEGESRRPAPPQATPQQTSEHNVPSRREWIDLSATADSLTVPSSVPSPDHQSAGPVSGYAHVDSQTEEIQPHTPRFEETSLPEATADAVRPAASHLQHDFAPAEVSSLATDHVARTATSAPRSGAEYEPEEASASYRVQLATPSQYVQTAPPVAQEEPAEEDPPPFTPRALEIAPSGEMFAPESHSLGPIDNSPVSTTYDAPAEISSAPESASHDATEPHHDVTTIHAEGAMVSHATDEAAPAEQPQATAYDDEIELAAGEPQSQTHFAPGAGFLEEDFLEEDELDGGTLQARGVEEQDDLEEEPLEAAADLGTMIHDLAVDQITGGQSELEDDDEDDFEEDTLEEDMESPDYPDDLEDPESAGTPNGSMEMEDYGAKIGLDSGLNGGNGAPAEANGRPPARRDEQERRNRRDGGRRPDRGADGRSRSRGSLDSRSSTQEPSSSDRATASDLGRDRSGLGERARHTGGGDRDRGRSSGRSGGRQSMQSTNLPAISELLKPGQEILCQIAKEPIAKKGARITSHIALPGRFLVFMPTVSHTGVSRKIESDGERRRLKEILLSEKGEAAGGFIVRTAAEGATEEELRSDLRFLLNLWTDIKQRSESSKSPALIYHDLNLVERILRDQVTDSFSAIWVDTETEYERVLRFLQRFQPGLIRRVKLYTKETPLFEQFGITEEINKALRSKVWLKSGGSIVINQTEALVAIDINTGKYVGKTARLEDTIVKTNLDAIPEIVRQIRLRDLGGIIIIDFIDMDERKNRNRVMQALEDELKNDRAPSKVLPFNDFGLVAITRKRVKQSLERTLSTTCNVCVGTGMVKSPITVCNDIYVEMRKMHKHLDRGDVMLRVHPEVVKQLKVTGSHWLQEMEEMCGKTILIKSDPSLHPEQFDIH